jgi:ATP-dependent DNA helicase RecQ
MDEQALLTDLHRRSNGAIVAFKPDQWRAIDVLCRGGGPVLLVQSTGWGKSLVYFTATLALRRAGAGPTLLISPLLALIRDQVRAASQLGLVAESITGENPEHWDRIAAALARDAVDLLLVSPERLGSDAFVSDRLAAILRRVALFVIDEAHCISDWGHDFRPDYQRIHRLLVGRLPQGVALLATTATANDRVVADVKTQLGPATHILRGPLSRASLRLQALALPDRAGRYAWLADTLPRLPGSGIIYTLTTREADRLADWLRRCGLAVEPYHARIRDGFGLEAAEHRRRREEALRSNRLKALVATSALGLGFDKPDLAFVVHYQRPASILQYYQQVGRAGRALESAYGVLLAGREDGGIVESFIANAFPPEDEVQAVLAALAGGASGLTLPELGAATDLPEDELEQTLRLLAATDPPPVVRAGSRWSLGTAPYRPDPARINALTRVRRQEWARMKAYLRTWGCLMRFLVRDLGDHEAGRCGRCANCLRRPLLAPRPQRASVAAAQAWLGRAV